MKRSLKELAQLIQAELMGDSSVLLNGVASIASAEPHDLVFVEHSDRLGEALASRAGAVIVSRLTNTNPTKPLLISPQPKLAFARAAAILHAGAVEPFSVHSQAVIAPTAKLGRDVVVEAFASIGEEAVIGDRTRIRSGCRIGDRVNIGCDCELSPNVTIHPRVRIGDRVVVQAGAVLGSDGFGYVRDNDTGRYVKFPQIGRLEIEDDVEIGANCTIDRGALDETRIGRGTKIDNLVHVGHNVRIGEDVVIAAQTGLSGSAIVENEVIIGGQVGIADHVQIQKGAILGAQCGIPSKKVIRGRGVVFWGTPARPIREYLKELATLSRMSKYKG